MASFPLLLSTSSSQTSLTEDLTLMSVNWIFCFHILAVVAQFTITLTLRQSFRFVFLVLAGRFVFRTLFHIPPLCPQHPNCGVDSCIYMIPERRVFVSGKRVRLKCSGEVEGWVLTNRLCQCRRYGNTGLAWGCWELYSSHSANDAERQEQAAEDARHSEIVPIQDRISVRKDLTHNYCVLVTVSMARSCPPYPIVWSHFYSVYANVVRANFQTWQLNLMGKLISVILVCYCPIRHLFVSCAGFNFRYFLLAS